MGIFRNASLPKVAVLPESTGKALAAGGTGRTAGADTVFLETAFEVRGRCVFSSAVPFLVHILSRPQV